MNRLVVIGSVVVAALTGSSVQVAAQCRNVFGQACGVPAQKPAFVIDFGRGLLPKPPTPRAPSRPPTRHSHRPQVFDCPMATPAGGVIDASSAVVGPTVPIHRLRIQTVPGCAGR